jgi:hypothetical protein
VPAQYVDSIKDAILGKWQFFWPIIIHIIALWYLLQTQVVLC